MKDILIRTAFRIVKAKAMPIINTYACKACGSIASVIVKDNAIKVNKCACVKVGRCSSL
jgi:predicted nucleic acid-binding Zn ribbon protein